MVTKEREYFILRGTVQRQKLDEDIDRILELYNDHGYVQARVESYDIQVDREKARATIRIVVVEGPQYQVGGDRLHRADACSPRRRSGASIGSRPATSSRAPSCATASGASPISTAPSAAPPPTYPAHRSGQPADPTINVTFEIDRGARGLRGAHQHHAATPAARRRSSAARSPWRRAISSRCQKLHAGAAAADQPRLLRQGQRRPPRPAPTRTRSSSTSTSPRSPPASSPSAAATAPRTASSAPSTCPSATSSAAAGRCPAHPRRRHHQQGTISFTEPWLFDRPLSAGFDLFNNRRIHGLHRRAPSAATSGSAIPSGSTGVERRSTGSASIPGRDGSSGRRRRATRSVVRVVTLDVEQIEAGRQRPVEQPGLGEADGALLAVARRPGSVGHLPAPARGSCSGRCRGCRRSCPGSE